MPHLPLAGPSPIDGGELPVRSSADVLAVFPAEVRRSANAPIRDALAAAMTAMFRVYQRRSRKSSALSDILRARGNELEGLARDRGVFKQPGETDTALLIRVLATPELVTPDAILDAVDAILAPYTPTRSKYFESELDQWFIDDGTAVWSSHVFETFAGRTPHYQDRLYADDVVENEGFSIPRREVLGAVPALDADVGRTFTLRIPPLEAVDNDGIYVFDSDVPDDGWFIDDGTAVWSTHVFTDQVQSDELYAAIVSVVDLLKGQGIRWHVFVDPDL